MEAPRPTPEGPEKRIAALEESLEALRRELEQERDAKLRWMAECENLRRRTQAEFQRIIEGASERIISQLLPVLDDFERLFDHPPEAVSPEALQQGVELIYRKLGAVLATEGLEPIDARDKPFDVDLHDAVASIEEPSLPPGTVISEVEKGYRLGGKVIRHARVMVSRQPEGEAKRIDEQA